MKRPDRDPLSYERTLRVIDYGSPSTQKAAFKMLRLHILIKPALIPFAILAGLLVLNVNAQDAPPQTTLEDVVLGATIVSLEDTKDVFKNADVRLPIKSGVLLTDVSAYGPAQEAGLKRLDVITRINKTQVANFDEFRAAVSALEPNKECEIAGYGSTETKSGKITWKRGSVKAKPVKRRELYMNAMRIKTDEVRDLVSYTHKDSTEFLNSGSEFYCYVIKGNDTRPTLRLKIQYVADEWLFVRRFTVKAGESTFEIDASGLGEMERDNEGGKIWEWYDRPVDAELKKMLTAIAASDRAILRFEGDQYRKDLEINSRDCDRLRSVLAVHEMLSSE